MLRSREMPSVFSWLEWPKSWHILRQTCRVTLAGVAFASSAVTPAPAGAEPALASPPAPDANSGRAGRPEMRKLELGVDVGAVRRPSAGAGVDYETGLRWSGHGTIVLLPNLGARLTGGMEYHALSIEPGALGAEGPATGEPNISGPHVLGQLQPMLELAPGLDGYALVGIGWQRFTADSVTLGEPTPLTIAERSGVLVELPLAVGARYAVLRDRMALALTFAFSAPLSQSGSLFDAGAGASQSLRQDTGELVRVDALPHFESATSASLSLDFFF